MKEDAEISIESMKEQYEAQDRLVGYDDYAVLIDVRKNTSAPPETRTFMANYNPPKRKATALITNFILAAQLVANFYIKFHKPKTPTKIFSDNEEAIKWLNEKLYEDAGILK